jgi:hypothetical protein
MVAEFNEVSKVAPPSWMKALVRPVMKVPDAEFLRMPPSRLSVAVALAPRTVGKFGSVTSAVPPMLMMAVLLSAAASRGKLLAEKVPPVKVRVWVPPLPRFVPVLTPPIDRMPTFATPPVWLKSVVALLLELFEVKRPIWRLPVPLRLNVALVLSRTPRVTPALVLVGVVSEPPLRL